MGDNFSDTEKIDRLILNLKAALLLHHKVVFRATAALESHLMRLLFNPDQALNNDDASILISEGILVPEVRYGDEEKLACESTLKRIIGNGKVHARHLMPIAEMLDASPEKELRDAQDIADKRTRYFINQIFRLWFAQPNYNYKWIHENVSISDIQDFFELHLPYQKRIPMRSDFRKDIRKIFKGKFGDYVLNNIYFMKGAEEANANILWTQEITPAKERDIWLCKYPLVKELNRIGVDSRKILDKHGFVEVMEIWNKSGSDNSIHIRPVDTWNSASLDKTMLSNLTFKEIIDVRKSEKWIDFVQHLFEIDDWNEIGRYAKEERVEKQKILKNATKASNKSEWFSVLSDITASLFLAPPSLFLKGLAYYFKTKSWAAKSKLHLSKKTRPILSFNEFLINEHSNTYD